MLELPFCNTSPGGHAPPNAIALDSPRAGDLVPEAGCYFTGDFAPKTKKIIVVKCYPSGYYITGNLPPGVRNLGGVPNHRDTGKPRTNINYKGTTIKLPGAGREDSKVALLSKVEYRLLKGVAGDSARYEVYTSG